MTISGRVQLLLGLAAAAAAYVLLVVYAGGRLDLRHLDRAKEFFQRPAAEGQARS